MRMVPGDYMPALRRTLGGIVPVLWAELRRIAAEEGPEGELIVQNADITADYVSFRQQIKITIEYRGKAIWSRAIALSEAELVNMSETDLTEKLTHAMRGHLSLIAQMHFARLAGLFPKAIRDVQVEYDVEKSQKIIVVYFSNGHIAKAPEHEAKTDLFTAQCSMLYDLPPR